MREESHLDEMRTAIRGDFERLAERRGEQDLMRVSDEASPEAVEPEMTLEEPDRERDREAQPEPEPEPEPAQRSWLARLFSPP